MQLDPLHAHYAALLPQSRRLTHDETISLQHSECALKLQRDPHALDGDTSRVASWIRTVHAVDQFVGEHDRVPVRNARAPRTADNAKEQALADWLRYQRRPRTRELHCSYQRLRLESIPGFDWAPNDLAWEERAHELGAFIREHGRQPRYRSNDANEKSLAAWEGRQLRLLAAGELLSFRAETLRDRVRGAGGDTLLKSKRDHFSNVRYGA